MYRVFILRQYYLYTIKKRLILKQFFIMKDLTLKRVFAVIGVVVFIMLLIMGLVAELSELSKIMLSALLVANAALSYRLCRACQGKKRAIASAGIACNLVASGFSILCPMVYIVGPMNYSTRIHIIGLIMFFCGLVYLLNLHPSYKKDFDFMISQVFGFNKL